MHTYMYGACMHAYMHACFVVVLCRKGLGGLFAAQNK